MKKKTLSFMLATGVALTLVVIERPRTLSAATTLSWQTTFNCNDWTTSMGLTEAVVCGAGDGISGSGGWATSGHPNGDEITSAANNPSGGGGKGFRHWRGDGQNNNGGGVVVALPSSGELWVRWYMRYQLGFAWSGGAPQYSKELYFNAHDGKAPQHAVGWKYSDGFGTTAFYPSRNMDGALGWLSTMRGATGDGLWHYYEVHMKKDTNGANGIFEAWIDGVRGAAVTDVNWGASNFSEFIVGENQYNPANGGDRYTDYDDIAVSTTGYIGSLSGGSPTPPSVPLNLRVLP